MPNRVRIQPIFLPFVCIALASPQTRGEPIDGDPLGQWDEALPPEIPPPPEGTGAPLANANARNSGLSTLIDLRPLHPEQGDLVAVLETATFLGETPGNLVELRFEARDNTLGNVTLGTTRALFTKAWTRHRIAYALPTNATNLHVFLRTKRVGGTIAVTTPTLTIETNRLQNPSAEQHPVTQSGWTAAEGDWDKPRQVEPAGGETTWGKSVFWAGRSAKGRLTQTVPLAAFSGWRASTTSPRAILSGHLGSFVSDTDSSEMTLETIDAAGQLLAGTTTGAVDAPAFQLRSLSLPIPPEAAAVRVSLISTRYKGDDNNGYFDNLALVFPGSGPEREPWRVTTNEEITGTTDAVDPQWRDLPTFKGPTIPLEMPDDRLVRTLSFSPGTPQLNGKPTQLFRYVATSNERLTVRVDRDDVILQIRDTSLELIRLLVDNKPNHVYADLLPGTAVLIAAISMNPTLTADVPLELKKQRTPGMGADEGDRKAIFGNPLFLKQMETFPARSQHWIIAHEFVPVGPKLDGLPTRVFRFTGSKGETIQFTMEPTDVRMDAFDVNEKPVEPTLVEPGKIRVRTPESGTYYLLLRAPKPRYFKAFRVALDRLAFKRK